MKRLPTLKVFEYLTLGIGLGAAILLILAPFWAYAWYQQPFLGVFIEPNLVSSRIGEEDWPARKAGVEWPDRLVSVNGQPVANATELNGLLQQSGQDASGNYLPVALSYERREGEPYEVTVTPRHVELGELAAQFIAPYLVGVALLGTGFWVFRSSGDREPACAFLLFTAAASVTTGAYFDMNTTHHVLLVWALSLPIAAASLGYLSFVFPKPLPFVKSFPWARLLPWLIALPLIVWDIREIAAPSDPWAYIQAWISGYGLAAIAILFFLGMLVVRFRTSRSPVTRQQSRIIVFGAGLAFGPVLLFYLIPFFFGSVPAFQSAFYFPPMVVFLFAVAYAIVRYRMLDVDRFLSLATTYLLTSIAALVIFYALLAVFSLLLQEQINASSPGLLALYLLLLVLFLNPLRNLAQRTIDRLFYRTMADYRHALSSLSQQLVLSPAVIHTQQILEREVSLALQPKHFILYLYDDDSQLYFPATSHPAEEMVINPENPLVRRFQEPGRALWLPPGQTLPEELSEQAGLLETLDCEVFSPLHYEGKLVGFMGLGGRRSGIPYSSDDLEFLNAVAAQSTLALENARLFTNLQRNLEETLEMKNLLDDIFASIASGVITTDMERKVMLFNQAAESILGIQADHVRGKVLEYALPALSPHLEKLAEATIQQGEVTIDEELSSSLPGRGDLFLRLSLTPLRDAQLGTKGATIVIDDLTEQRQLEAEQERIRQTFGRVVAPRVRDKLLSDPGSLRLDGVRQQIAIMFADLHGFTSFSERSGTEELFEILNSYLSLAAKVILDEEGTLDKFMGDAVLAMWNAPDPQPDYAMRAVRAALAINKVIAEHRRHLPEEQRLHFSIGITCGEAMVGNVGTNELFNYTAIGDSVNLAQRLEAVAEPEQILLSEAAYQMVSGHVSARQLAPIKVKGREKEEVVFELVGLVEGG